MWRLFCYLVFSTSLFTGVQVWKTLETTDNTLMDMIVGKEYDIRRQFEEEWQPPKSPLERDKRRGSRLETEDFYLSVSSRLDIYAFFNS